MVQEYSNEEKVSIEMAARKLRYKWFEQLATENNFDKIATAHHLDDSVETILMNLSRKTGIRGLIGIPERNGKIIRPLLYASKSQILDYCKQNKLEYRIDKTNLETNYQRNKIRHLIVPQFIKINSAFSQNVLKTAENLKQYQRFFAIIKISIEKLKIFEPLELFMFEYLKDFGFNNSQIETILSMLENQSGKIFFADEYRLVKERKYLIVSKIPEIQNVHFFIDKNTKNFKINVGEIDELKLESSFLEIDEVKLKKNRNIASFDAEKLVFPLKIRKWQDGDFFKPYGMKGKKKKLSSFFKDEKLTQIEKENTWIIESNSEIIWIVGYRTDEKFKITKNTSQIFVLKMQK